MQCAAWNTPLEISDKPHKRLKTPRMNPHKADEVEETDTTETITGNAANDITEAVARNLQDGSKCTMS